MRLNLSTRQTLSFISMLGMLAFAIAGFSIQSNLAADRTAQAVTKSVAPMIELAQALNEMQRARINLRDALLATQSGKKQAEVLAYEERYRALAASVSERLDRIEADLTDPSLKAALDESRAGVNELMLVVQKIESATKARDFDTAINLMLTECFVTAKKAYDAMIVLLELESNALQQVLVDERRLTEESLIQTALGSLVLGAIIAWLTFKTIRRINGGLGQAVSITTAIAAGDLTVSSQSNGRDEIDHLMNKFNAMTVSLRQTVLGIHQGTHSLDEAIGVLETSGQSLDKTTKQVGQAAQGTSSAVVQLTHSMESVNQSASDALAIVQESQKLSMSSRQKISGLVGEIGHVESSVSEISRRVMEFIEATRQIDKMTEDVKKIAEQTNLLALNAAIEAARAGEQGRGFAVVADEVRQLAESSSHSADRIAETTGNLNKLASVVEQVVNQGLVSIERSRVEADQAVSSIDQTHSQAVTALDHVEQIASEMNEQSQAAQVVSKNMADILDLLQATRGSVSSSKECTDKLLSVARDLREHARHFRTESA